MLYSSSRKLIVALCLVLDVAYHQDGSGMVQSATVAQRSGLPRRHVERLLRLLVQGRVLASGTGPRGGYRLAAEPCAITARMVVEALSSARDEHRNNSVFSQAVVLPLWKKLEATSMAELGRITLEELCQAAQEAGISRADHGFDYTI